jgi:hypothetical protein
MDRRQFAIAAAASLAIGTAAQAASKPPETWDGLVRVGSKRLKFVYLAPGADFRAYRKVMIDPTEVAFRKDWKRDYNATTTGLEGRVQERDIQQAVEKGGAAATEIFAEAFAAGGFPVVTEPGPDVLRVRTGVINLHVSAPDIRRSGRNRTYADEAGSATLVVEVRDSITGAMLGRAVDSRIAGDDSYMTWRNSVTNRADFRQVGKRWAQHSVTGLKELQALSPIDANGLRAK